MPERRPPSHACEDEAREALQKARQAVDAAGVPRAAACLLDGWGLRACGASLAAATSRAAEIEALARIWWHVLQLEK